MRLFGGWLDITKRLQRERYGVEIDQLRGEDYAGAVMMNVTASVAELGEYLQETQWKPWKKTVDAPDRERRAERVEELVDVLHFVANLLALEGVDDAELSAVYLDKVNKNRTRSDHHAHSVALPSS